MSRSITLGSYLPGDSFLHRANPRFKILILLLFLAALFMMKSFTGLGLVLVLLLLIMLAVPVPWRYLAGGLRPLGYIILFTVVIYFFFTKGGLVLLRLGPLTVEQAGVSAGLFMILRLAGLVFVSMLLTL
ncbi:MAG: energy-coupling factor transporter transmembrane protein EcfT, partial [Firmicutes bacterium]|nr:energy-coupling factor transporter transmembrane protein EcfT [Bacillota bacterium]